ncbi:replication-relaxation family protein [Streptomyces violascens]|uniref:replication-relaxation family protein n=1 Tax=Streptomyces violascens TaxID=67381 RepID=UPI003659C329
MPVWLSERSVTRLWGDWIRPDAYAHTTHGNGQLLPFFLEYDTGSYNLARLEAKLPGYAALATTTATRTPLFVHTASAAREAALRHRLTDTADRLDLPIATGNTQLADPTGAAWLPLGPTPSTRLTPAQLATHWSGIVPALTPETAMPQPGRHTTLPWHPIPPQPPTAGA